MRTGTDLEAQPVDLQSPRQDEMQETDTRPSCSPESNAIPTLLVSSAQVINPELEEEHSCKPSSNDPPVDADPHNGSTHNMVGHFDNGADALQTIFEEKVKKRDKEQFKVIKGDMDSVFLLGGLFAAALTPLVLDAKQNLKADPTDQIVYYLKQHSTILNQISEQISFIAPQVSIPSTPPPPFPPFKPSTSYIALNVFWFFALVYSILGALVATLIQQWIRRCQRTVQRPYGDPTKIAWFRQYLFERLYSSQVTEFAPTMHQASILLFLVGLCISTWNLNTNVAIIVTIYSSTGFGLFYLFAFAGSLEAPDSENRNGIDKREAIRWLVDNLKEDAELESFVSAIPGSFNTDWGVGVWKKLSEISEDESKTRSTTSALAAILSASPFGPFSKDKRRNLKVSNVYARLRHLLDTCNNPFLFETPEKQRKRTRACIEATALLVCRANAELDRFGDITKLLGVTGITEKTRDMSSVEMDGPFVIHWTCLSLLTIRSILKRNTLVQNKAKLTIETFARGDDTGDDQALTAAQNVDGTFRDARSFLLQINDALIQVENASKEQVISIIHDHESQVSQLEDIHIGTDRLSQVDQRMYDVQSFIVATSQGITLQLPGVQFKDFDAEIGPAPMKFSRLVEWSHGPPTQFIFPGQTLKSICSLGSTFRSTLEGMWDPDAHQQLLENVKEFLQDTTWKENLVQRQLWRLQDLRDGGGLGFSVELFFLALKQLLSATSSNESNSLLYIGAFQAITSDWDKYKTSSGTQNLLLDMISTDHGIIFKYSYPTYITDEFFGLLRKFFEEHEQGCLLLDVAIRKLSAHTSEETEQDVSGPKH